MFRLTLACCVAWLLVAPPEVAAQPSTAALVTSFELRLSDGRTTYRLGEEIPVELVFSGRSDADFYFSNQSYDRSGRMRIEAFGVTPSEGTEDPMADLFADGVIGGGLFSSHPLDGSPLVIRVALNDWVWFAGVGTYQITTTSSRLQRHSRLAAPTLAAAPVTLTIVAADESWDREQTALATALIDRGEPADVRHGAALLRYLHTEPAAIALTDRHDAIAAINPWEAQAGLITSPHRAVIVSHMEARLDEGAPVGPTFIPTLSRLRAWLDVPTPGPSAGSRFERARVAEAEYQARARAALRRLLPARAFLSTELMRLDANVSDEAKREIAQGLDQNPADAASAFADLRPETQAALLANQQEWTYLKRAWIAPSLRQVYEDGRTINPGARPLADIALKRLYDLQPADARALMLEEMRTGRRGVSYETLSMLPDREVPELDGPLEAKYESGGSGDVETLRVRQTSAWLIARYGSMQLLPFIEELLRRPGLPCADQAAALTYLLKHATNNPMERLDLGAARVGGRGCVDPLPAIADRFWDARVESAVVTRLLGADLEAASTAAQMLGAHGSKGAREELIARIIRLSEESPSGSQGRTGDARTDLSTRLENAIVNALFDSRQFETLDAADIATLRAACASEPCRTQVDIRARIAAASSGAGRPQ